MEIISCKKCGSYDKVKAGFVRGKQRYQCKQCLCRYLPNKNERVNSKLDAVELYLEGVCLRSIGRLLKVSHVTAIKWIKKESVRLRPLLPLNADHIEIDELYLYMKNKNRKRWLWIALCRESKRILGFHLGGRGRTSLQKLYYKISPIECIGYYTDGHAPYKNILPKEKHSCIPGQTNTIEGINSAIRHYLSRFRRRSKCYNKSASMVEASMNLLMYKYDKKHCEQLSLQAA